MNIIEAIKSGKRFRRKGHIEWIGLPNYEGEEFSFNLDELVAEDWETEPEAPRYSIFDCINALSFLRNSSHDMSIGMIDSIIFYLKKGI